MDEKEVGAKCEVEGCTWHPEWGSWMIESTPSKPYSNYASDLLRVERNMILRRRRILSALGENEIAPTVTSFPLMGVGTFYAPATEGDFEVPYSHSLYVPDKVINSHVRFSTLAQNIRIRRTSKVNIKVPLFRDVNTPEFIRRPADCEASPTAVEPLTPSLPSNIEKDEFIHMDCMAFGMGMCCLQVTFQACDIDESRYIFDQLTVLAPIMLAMTAASPIFKGRLADVDARWSVIAQSVDDRTPAERGEIPEEELEGHIQEGLAGGAIKRLYKSRYDSISTYLYHCDNDPNCKNVLDAYNDIPCPIDDEVKQKLLDAGIDDALSQHIAHLYTRDPLVIFEDHIELDDEQSMDHFENIQSTNWQTVRWKPPPPRVTHDDPHIGWRAEFRSMEVQLTDFENAAFTVFVVLATRVVLSFDLCLYLPLSKVDENMQRAHSVDSVNKQKFFFRKVLAPLASDDELTSGEGCGCTLKKSTSVSRLVSEVDHSVSYEEMTLDQILNGTGKEEYYPGLIPLVYAYLDYINCDAETLERVSLYLDFISKRASGKLITPATWMRNFVRSHPAYKGDSIITEEIAYDLMIACKDIGEGLRSCPELLGDNVIKRVRPDDAYGHILPGRLNSTERSELLEKLIRRARKPMPAGVARGTSAH